MNIQTVAENLRVTIAGKEKYLSEVYEQRKVSNGDDIVSFVTAQMLEFNIDELRRILGDVEQCIEKAEV
jgi:DNA-binding winged helix-turn-helix (wHTH) protein